MDKYADAYKTPEVTPKSLPSLRSLYDPKTENMKLEEIRHHVSEVVFPEIKLSHDEVKSVEDATKGQSSSSDWYSMRAGRLTASNFKTACHTDPSSPSLTLIKNVCYPEKSQFSSMATNYGLDHENDAKKDYILQEGQNHTNLCVKDSGLMLNTIYPWMGASPDGIVTCDCHSPGCLEVKCPHKHQSTNSILDACEDADFCLHIVNGRPTLKKTHPYFYQV